MRKKEYSTSNKQEGSRESLTGNLQLIHTCIKGNNESQNTNISKGTKI